LVETRQAEAEDYTLYSSHSVWQSKRAFEAWTKSSSLLATKRARAGRLKPRLEELDACLIVKDSAGPRLNWPSVCGPPSELAESWEAPN
jgi:heme-degrading monooxygenase HmoA